MLCYFFSSSLQFQIIFVELSLNYILNILAYYNPNFQIQNNIENTQMGCGSSNQVHDASNPTPIGTKSDEKQQMKQQPPNVVDTKCYLFGQSSGERKVVLFNSTKMHMSTLSSRIRIPIAKIKLEPIQILYEESQQVILPDLMKRQPSPPFNHMFGTFCRNDIIFLCGGISYEGETVYSESYFYNTNSGQNRQKSGVNGQNQIANNKMYIKFEQTTSMDKKRYSHMGLYYNDTQAKKQFVYVMGGKDSQHQPTDSCEKFDFATKKWKTISSMFTPRAEGCAMLLLNKIYVFGGISTMKQYVQTIQVFDIKSQSWFMLNMRLHRGIKSCMMISAHPNEILIFGGITGIDNDECKLNSIIKVNLIQQTYVWQSSMPEKICNIKYSYEKDKNKVSIFSNQNNLIYSYDVANKTWKTLNVAYKSYIPISDLKGFSCVTQALDLKFQPISPEFEIVQSNGNELEQIFILGNENYPCSINFVVSQQIKIEIRQLSMKLHLRSNMGILATKYGYYMCGGSDSSHRHSSNQMFLYDPEAPMSKSVKQLATMKQGRHSAGMAVVNKNIYAFGGYKSKKQIIKSIQKYNIKQNNWVACTSMLKSISEVNTFTCKQLPNKILLFGGREDNGDHNSLIQLYDAEKDQIITYSQFPVLAANNPVVQFVQIVSEKQIQNLRLQQAEKFLQIAQYYSNKSSLQKQQLQNSSSNQSVSMKKSRLEEANNKTKNIALKNLAVEHIPISTRKQSIQQIELKKQVVLNVIQIQPSRVQIQPSKKQGSLNIQAIQIDDGHESVRIDDSSRMSDGMLNSRLTQQLREQKKQQQQKKKIESNQKTKVVKQVKQMTISNRQIQQQNIEFVELNKMEQQNKKPPKMVSEQQASSQSLIIENKNIEKQKQIKTNQNTHAEVINNSIVIKITQYEHQSQHQHQHQHQQSDSKIHYPFTISQATIFYLLVDRATYAMQLLKCQHNSTRVLKQGIRVTHGFRIDKPGDSNRHCFLNLQESIGEGGSNMASLYFVDTTSFHVQKVSIQNMLNNELSAQCASFTIPKIFV